MTHVKPLASKGICIFIIVLFIFEQLCTATPNEMEFQSVTGRDRKSMNLSEIIRDPSNFRIPWECSSVKEIHRGTNGKLIIHIQDAHANFGGQINLAKMINFFIKHYGISLVLVEGGAGDVSLDYLKESDSVKDWKVVAKRFLYEGLISGEEYLNLTTTHPMKIIGVEEEQLYYENLDAYASLNGSREENLRYLHQLKTALNRIKFKLYPKDILSYEDLEDNETESRPEHLNVLINLASQAKINLSEYSEIFKIRDIEKLESNINFSKVNEEQTELLDAISNFDSQEIIDSYSLSVEQQNMDHAAQYFMLKNLVGIAKDHQLMISQFSALLEYLSYLRMLIDLNIEDMIEQSNKLKDHAYRNLLPSETALKVYYLDQYLKNLTKAHKISLSANEYNFYKSNVHRYKSEDWEAFLNQNLAELGYFENFVPHKETLNDSNSKLINFYNLVNKRDAAFVSNTAKIMSKNQSDIAFLIAGGYHTQNLTHLLKQNGYSYIVLTPHITSKTDYLAYERLLFANRHIKPSSGLILHKTHGFLRQAASRLAIQDRLKISPDLIEFARAHLSERTMQNLDFRNTAASGARLTIEKPHSDEVVVSQSGLKGVFANYGESARIINTILGDPKQSRQDQVELSSGERKVTFTKRKAGPKKVWVFKDTQENKEIIAAAAGLQIEVILEEPHDSEMAVTQKALEAIFVSPTAAAKKINQVLGDPNKSDKDQASIGEAGKQVNFIRRTVGPHKLWVFKNTKSNRDSIREYFDLTFHLALDDATDNDVVVSAPALDGIYGNAEAAAKKINAELGDPVTAAVNEKTIQMGGSRIIFLRKKIRGKFTWTFSNTEADIELIAERFGLNMNSYPRVTGSEVVISARGLADVVVNAGDAKDRVIRDIGEPENHPTGIIQLTHNNHTITMFRARSHKYNVWAWTDTPENRETFAGYFGLELKPAKSEEQILVSQTELSGIYARPREASQRIRTALGEPSQGQDPAIVGEADETTVLYPTQGQGKKWFWTFKNSERNVKIIATHFGLQADTLLERVHRDEVAASANGLKGIFIGRIEAAGKINRALGNPGQNTENQKEYGDADNRILFKKRKKGPKPVWAFKESDKDKVAKIFDIQIDQGLPEVSSIDVPVTVLGLRNYVQNSPALQQSIIASIADPKAVSVQSIVYGSGSNQILFKRRRSGPQIIWSFDNTPSNWEKLRFHFDFSNIQELESVNDNEILVNKYGLSGWFWAPKYSASVINKELSDDRYAGQTAVTLGDGENQITFYKRRNGSVSSWTFVNSQKNRDSIAIYFNLKSNPDLEVIKDNEIAVSQKGLIGVFVNSTASALIVNEKLGDPFDADNGVVVIGEDENKITFTVRNVSPETAKPAWTFEDTQKNRLLIANHFGIKMAVDVEALIEEYNLQKEVASLAHDPQSLYSYILMTTNIAPEIARTIVTATYSGLRGNKSADQPIINFNDYIELTEEISELSYPEATEDAFVTLEGKIDGDFTHIQVSGDRDRVVPVGNGGEFKMRIVLRRSSTVSLILFGFNEENKTRSRSREISIDQTSKPQDLDEIMSALLAERQDILESLEQDEYRFRHLMRQMERSMLRHFTLSEEAGFEYLTRRIAETDIPENRFIHRLYLLIEEKFKEVEKIGIEGFNEGERLYFYQKYTIYEIIRRMEDADGPKGVLLALEQGLGKSIVFLSVAREHKSGAIIVTPNAVVSSIGEQESKFFNEQRITLAKGQSARVKTQAVRRAHESASEDKPAQVVVNIEYLRADTHNRFDAMNTNPDQIVVIDESQFINRPSLQSEGAQKLEGSFYLLSSATPITKVGDARNVIDFLSSEPAFSNARVFSRLFQRSDPDSLRLLHFLISEYVIRIKKQDVFELYDKNLPLEEQKDRLPEKVEIPPNVLGEYELTMEQAVSNFRLFSDWSGWVENQIRQERTVDDLELQKRQKNENYFSRMHATMQIENDPRYFGSDTESPKYNKIDEIVNKEVVENDGKIVIFTRYKKQVREYLERYRHLGSVTYYGDSGRGEVSSRGFLVGEDGGELTFKMKNKNEYAIGGDGLLISDPDGTPITPLDYNRLRFQNDPSTRIIIASYDTGSVGVTFTAADAVVRDMPARDYPIQYQADDRANRIDNKRKRYETRYYSLVPKYPEAFLDQMRELSVVSDPATGETMVINRNLISEDQRMDPDLEVESVYEKYFSQGTYTEYLTKSLEFQKRVFDLVIDGIQSEGDLRLLQEDQLRVNVPFLFDDRESNDVGSRLSQNQEITSVDSENLWPTINDDPNLRLDEQSLDVIRSIARDPSTPQGARFAYAIDELSAFFLQVKRTSEVALASIYNHRGEIQTYEFKLSKIDDDSQGVENELPRDASARLVSFENNFDSLSDNFTELKHLKNLNESGKQLQNIVWHVDGMSFETMNALVGVKKLVESLGGSFFVSGNKKDLIKKSIELGLNVSVYGTSRHTTHVIPASLEPGYVLGENASAWVYPDAEATALDSMIVPKFFQLAITVAYLNIFGQEMHEDPKKAKLDAGFKRRLAYRLAMDQAHVEEFVKRAADITKITADFIDDSKPFQFASRILSKQITAYVQSISASNWAA